MLAGCSDEGSLTLITQDSSDGVWTISSSRSSAWPSNAASEMFSNDPSTDGIDDDDDDGGGGGGGGV